MGCEAEWPFMLTFWQAFLTRKVGQTELRGVSHFHFYENLVAANLGMRFTL